MIEQTTIDGRAATVTYITRTFQPTDPDNADMAKVWFEDTGEIAFLVRPAPAEKAFDPNQSRDQRGRWSPSGVSGPSSPSDGGLKNYIQTVVDFSKGQAVVDKYVLEHGQPYAVDDNTFIGGEPHACYKNATLALMRDPDLTYVEGYVSVHGVPIAHAWNVDKQGRVRDHTLTSDIRKAVKGYFGVPFQRNFALSEQMKNKVYGLLTGQEWNAKGLKRLLAMDPKKVVQS